MYSKKSWGGSVDPFINVVIAKAENIPEGEDPIMSFVIFEYLDKNLVGVPIAPNSTEVSEEYKGILRTS